MSKRSGTPAASGKLITLPIDQIEMDPATQMRERLDAATVKEYAEALAAGAKFPPPVVYHDGRTYRVGDGVHRIAANRDNGRKNIRCEVRQGDRRAAILYAIGANQKHGLRPTPADKRRTVSIAIQDEELRKLSDRKLSRICGVSHTFVSQIRKAGGGNVATLATMTTGLCTASEPLDSPLKWHGGKGPLAARIVGIIPPHLTYVEPFAGGLSVLLAKSPEGISEIVNDLDGELANFWNTLRDEKLFKQLLRMAQATPFSESIWDDCDVELKSADLAKRAFAFFVRCRQSLAGRMKSFAPLSVTRTRRGMNEQAAAWLSAVDGLAAVHERLKRVAMLSRDAIDVIHQHDSSQTAFYIDPPYLPEERTAPDVYAHEMTADQHRQLLKVVKKCKGSVILSGYPSELYASELHGWQRIEISRANSAAGGKSKRRMIETLWCNFRPGT